MYFSFIDENKTFHQKTFVDLIATQTRQVILLNVFVFINVIEIH